MKISITSVLCLSMVIAVNANPASANPSEVIARSEDLEARKIHFLKGLEKAAEIVGSVLRRDEGSSYAEVERRGNPEHQLVLLQLGRPASKRDLIDVEARGPPANEQEIAFVLSARDVEALQNRRIHFGHIKDALSTAADGASLVTSLQ